eukprot:GEMP01025556.1.p1 GENE.GEMP01025556.1~~GEMP01025556.1.p1  ORF type:complete len:418 (+),score=74.08 GEMP01025556.1:187-1440(+)
MKSTVLSGSFKSDFALYFAISNTSCILNRWFLDGRFPFPFILTAAHMIVTCVFFAPMTLCHHGFRDRLKADFKESWRSIISFSILNAYSVALSNASMMHIELGLSRVIRGLTPVITVILRCYVIETPDPTTVTQQVSLTALAVGVSLVWIYTEPEEGAFWGCTYSFVGAVILATQIVLCNRVAEGKYPAKAMIVYTAMISSLVLIPAVLIFEGKNFLHAVTHDTAGPSDSSLLHYVPTLCVACVIMVAHHALTFQANRHVGQFGMAMIDNAQLMVLLIMADFTLGELKTWGRIHAYGLGLICIGSLSYGSSKTWDYVPIPIETALEPENLEDADSIIDCTSPIYSYNCSLDSHVSLPSGETFELDSLGEDSTTLTLSLDEWTRGKNVGARTRAHDSKDVWSADSNVAEIFGKRELVE